MRSNRLRPWKWRPLLVLFWACLSVAYFFFQDKEERDSGVVIQDIPASNHCQFYDGVLWISQGDRNGAAGTIFYLFILNQLLYAEKYNLQPWIHLNTVSRHVYDPAVHSQAAKHVYQFPDQLQASRAEYKDPLVDDKLYQYPGKPQRANSGPISVEVQGTGVWSSYFQSKIPFTSRNQQDLELDLSSPCTHLPILNLHTDEQLVRGLHLACPYCVRSWKYGGVPPSLKLPTNYHHWWAPLREQGHGMVQKYYHSMEVPQPPSSTPCLAMHIRHSDKANKRDKIPLKAFLPYCQAFVELGGTSIYLATDSSRVLEKIRAEWPPEVVQVMTWQSNSVRSPDATPVFDGRNASHHRTNREVLWDIQQMARCDWFLHGLSAVSEATIYTNPQLHEQSVNLEFYTFYQRHKHSAKQPESDAPMSVEAFRDLLLKTGLKQGG